MAAVTRSITYILADLPPIVISKLQPVHPLAHHSLHQADALTCCKQQRKFELVPTFDSCIQEQSEALHVSLSHVRA